MFQKKENEFTRRGVRTGGYCIVAGRNRAARTGRRPKKTDNEFSSVVPFSNHLTRVSLARRRIQPLLQRAILERGRRDVASPEELAAYVQLRDCGPAPAGQRGRSRVSSAAAPAAELLHACPQVLVLQDIHRLVRDAARVEDGDAGVAEATLRRLFSPSGVVRRKKRVSRQLSHLLRPLHEKHHLWRTRALSERWCRSAWPTRSRSREGIPCSRSRTV